MRSTDQETLPFVHIHKDACEAAERVGFAPEVLARIFVNSWMSLRRTPGSKMKRLTGTAGNDWRLRIESHRCVASLVKRRDGQLCAFIHQFEGRAEVYETDTFHTRIREFWRHVDEAKSEVDLAPFARNYREANPADAKIEDLPRGILHHELKPKQQQFSDLVLPIRASTREHKSRLIIGYGPPGSGKTVVAQDLVLGAVADGLKVDVLVPSAPLKAEYRRLFSACGLTVSESAEDDGDVRLLEFPEHFAMLAKQSIDHSRDRQIREWWNTQISDPKLKARLGSAVVSQPHSRLPLLVDAVLEDDDFWKRWPEMPTARDFIGDQVRECIEALRGLKDFLEPCAPSGEPLPTRARLAVEAIERAKSEEPPRGDRLILVDEAQDLAPAECRALLSFWLKTRNDDPHAIRELVFLGDQEQRISLIPFSWDELKQAAIRLKIKPDQIQEQEVDNASYRMRQTIARVARSVWDPRVRGDGKFRQQGKIDLNLLEKGGSVDVLVTTEAIDWNAHAAQCMRDAAAGEYLFVVSGLDDAPPKDDSRIFSYHVRQAKGLEASKVIVNCPFGHQGKRRERNPLPADDVMEFYVAASRARERLLLILDEASWHELRRCREPWQLPGVRVHEWTSPEPSKLQSLLRDCVVTLSDDELRQTLLGQLATRCEASEHGATPDVSGIIRLVRRLCDLPDPDLIESLLFNSTVLARHNVSVLQQLWVSGIDAHRAGESTVAAGILLLAGETGAALKVATTAKDVSASCWDLEFLELYADDSYLQVLRKTQSLDEIVVESTSQMIQRLTSRLVTDRLRLGTKKISEFAST